MAPNKYPANRSTGGSENFVPKASSSIPKPPVANSRPTGKRRYATRATTRRALADLANRFVSRNAEGRAKNQDMGKPGNRNSIKNAGKRTKSHEISETVNLDTPPNPGKRARNDDQATAAKPVIVSRNSMIANMEVDIRNDEPMAVVDRPMSRKFEKSTMTDPVVILSVNHVAATNVQEGVENDSPVVLANRTTTTNVGRGSMDQVVGDEIGPVLHDRSKRVSVHNLLNPEVIMEDVLIAKGVLALPPNKAPHNIKTTHSLETEPLPPNVQDIDVKDVGNDVAEWSHAVAVHTNLKLREAETQAPDNYLEVRGITTHSRRVLVNWIVDVSTQFSLSHCTVHLAVNIMDRFLAKTKVSDDRLSLVAVAATWIASKYENVSGPSLAEFYYISNGVYSQLELKRMEGLMLNSLDWQVTVPTMPQFVARAIKALRVTDVEKITNVANFACEVALCEPTMLKWPPSQIAAAAVALGVYFFSAVNVTWDATLEFHTGGYSLIQLEPCIKQLWNVVKTEGRRTGYLDAVRRKHASPDYGRISDVMLSLEYSAIVRLV